MPRYRFDEFTLSPRRRLLARAGRELPLIPRYFDLLVFLIEHRHEAINRQAIFDRVWSDAVVSDSALSQAIRTLRRTLDDDSREPRFIRTVARHGYRFVFDGVIEEEDDEKWTLTTPVATAVGAVPALEAAEERIQWTSAAGGASLAGAVVGIAGGLVLVLAPEGRASWSAVPVLGVIGGAAGAIGGAGVAMGLALAEPAVRWRPLAFVAGGVLGGGLVGLGVQLLMQWTLSAVAGVTIPFGGGVEGLAIGAAAGLAYVMAASLQRLAAIAVFAALCGIATVALTAAGRPLVGGTLHEISQMARGSQMSLAPLGQLLGETDFGPVTQHLLGAGEGTVFGIGFAWGLFRSRRSHKTLKPS